MSSIDSLQSYRDLIASISKQIAETKDFIKGFKFSPLGKRITRMIPEMDNILAIMTNDKTFVDCRESIRFNLSREEYTNVICDVVRIECVATTDVLLESLLLSAVAKFKYTIKEAAYIGALYLFINDEEEFMRQATAFLSCNSTVIAMRYLDNVSALRSENMHILRIASKPEDDTLVLDEISNQNLALQETVRKLAVEKKEVSCAYDDLKSKYDTSTEKYDVLTQAHEALTTDYETSIAHANQYTIMKKQLEKMTAEHDTLKQKNEDLTADYKDHITTMEKDLKKMTAEHDTLKKTISAILN